MPQLDIFSELREIGKLLTSAEVLTSVRREVASVMKEGFVVTDGKHHVASSGKGYEVVVSCGDQQSNVSRRLHASMPDLVIENIANGVLGIRTARRVKKMGDH